jgi:hypothetical protein
MFFDVGAEAFQEGLAVRLISFRNAAYYLQTYTRSDWLLSKTWLWTPLAFCSCQQLYLIAGSGQMYLCAVIESEAR